MSLRCEMFPEASFLVCLIVSIVNVAEQSSYIFPLSALHLFWTIPFICASPVHRRCIAGQPAMHVCIHVSIHHPISLFSYTVKIKHLTSSQSVQSIHVINAAWWRVLQDCLRHLDDDLVKGLARLLSSLERCWCRSYKIHFERCWDDVRCLIFT